MDTLVLSQSYQPMGRVSIRRAVNYLLKGKVEVVEAYEDRQVTSVTASFQLPSVVRFLYRIIRKKKAVKFSRANVYERDNGKCQYCGKRVAQADFTYDHVLPRKQGGKTVWENVVVSCIPCNQRKGSKTPAQAGMKLRSRPVRPKKLSNTWRVTITWQEGMPPSWRDFLAAYTYWNEPLDSG